MFEKIISRICASLTKRNIDYIIIGGQALLLYGEMRLTKDIDITLGINLEGLPELLECIKEAQLRILIEDVEKFTRQTMVVPSIEDSLGIRVDFILSFTEYEKEAIKRANVININGVDVRFASKEDLVIQKIFAGRPRDIEDVKSIIRKNRDLNTQYIERWLSEFDRSFEGMRFVETFKGLFKD